MSSMIAAAGVDTLENARCDRRALRAEHVPVGQSRSTLGGSTLSSRHAHVFVFASERSRDRERHPRRPPKIAQLVHRYDASFCLLAEPVHFTLLLGRRTTAQPLSRSRRTEFHARNLRRRRRRADGGGGGAVGAPPALPRRRLRRHRVAATPARRRARRPFASRRRSRRERSRHVPFARSLARASRHRVSIRVTRGRTAAGSDASRHTPPRRARWRRVASAGDASRRGATRCGRTRTRAPAPPRRRVDTRRAFEIESRATNRVSTCASATSRGGERALGCEGEKRYASNARDGGALNRSRRRGRGVTTRSLSPIAALPGGAVFAPPGGERRRDGDGSARRRRAILFRVDGVRVRARRTTLRARAVGRGRGAARASARAWHERDDSRTPGTSS